MVTRERVEGRGPFLKVCAGKCRLLRGTRITVAHTLSLVCLGSPMGLAVVGG